MKRFFFGILLGAALLGPGCEEIPPVINPFMGEPPDTTINIEDQQKQVLIEEFTGVRCVQCPAGSADIETYLAIHGEQLIAVSIHAGGFSFPFDESVHDFRTDEGEALISFLGPPIGYPCAVVDRKRFDGKNTLILGRNEWAGYIEQQKALPPLVKIGLKSEFNEATRQLDLEATIYPQEAISEPDVRISVMLTENDIVDYQETPDFGKKSDYNHKHVLRDMLTSHLGEEVSEPLTPGTTIVKNFSTILNPDWKEAKMKAIAFVHLGGASKDVLQAVEVSVLK